MPESSLNSSAIATRRAKNYSEAKKRFLKSAKKLHLLHNHYIVSLKEGELLSADVKSKLTPYLAEQQLAYLRETNEKIKDLLESYAEVTDFTGEKFQALQWRVKNYLTSIREKDDYKDIREKMNQANKWPAIKRPSQDIKFDQKLIAGHIGSLKLDELAVDTFTFDSLKNV